MFILGLIAVLYLIVLLPIFWLHFRYGWLKSLLVTVVIWCVTTTVTSMIVSRLVD